MQVNVYNVDQSTGVETFDMQMSLEECIGLDDDEYERVHTELRCNWRSIIGGGAAPLYVLIRTV